MAGRCRGSTFRFVTRPTGWPTKVLIRTDLGAASLIARQAPIASSPNGHDSLQVLAPPDPASPRGVEHDLNGLFVVLGLVSLVVGAQFLPESVTVGVFGGLLGSSAGIIAVVVVSAVNGGTPVLDLSLAAAAR